MVPTSAPPPLYRKWKPVDSPFSYWLLCLKSVQLGSLHPLSAVTTRWNQHLVVPLTARRGQSLQQQSACFLIGSTSTWTHCQLCMRSANGTASGSVSRLQRSVSCSAKPSTALGFKFRLHLRPHTPRCWCVEADGRGGRRVCLRVWGSSSWSERLGFLLLLVLSSKKSFRHNPSKQSCLHGGNSHE